MKSRAVSLLETGLVIDLGILFLLAPYLKNTPKFCFVTGLLLWTSLCILRRGKYFYKQIVPRTSLNIPIFLFFAAAIISVIHSTDPYHSQSIFFERYLPFAVLFWISYGVVRDDSGKVSLRKVYWLASAIVLSALIMGIGGVRDYLLYRPWRLFTVYGHKVMFNMLPLYLVYFMPFTYALAVFYPERRMRLFSVFAFITVFLCWIWQGCRTAWIAIPLAILSVTFLKNKKLSGAILLAFILVFSFFSRAQVERVKNVLCYKEWSVPFEVWSIAVAIWNDHPLFGGGVGTYEHLMEPYGKALGYPDQRQKYLHAHSVYFETAAEMGSVGLTFFLYLFYVFFSGLVRCFSLMEKEIQPFLLGLAGAVLATLLMGTWASIITVGVAGPSFFWVMLGLAVSLADRTQVLTEPALNHDRT